MRIQTLLMLQLLLMMCGHDAADESFDDKWNEFIDTLNDSKHSIQRNWTDEQFRKAFNKFIQKFKKSVKHSDKNTLTRLFHDFAQEKKKKNSYLIPVQSTAIARRMYKHRGRTQSQGGRRHKEVARKTQMFLTQNDELVWSSLNTKKRKRDQTEHSLSEAIANNRPNAKKH